MAIKIDLKIFLFFLIFYFFHQVEIYALLLFFALLHEIGHLLAGLLLGYEPDHLHISPIGISISFKEKWKKHTTKMKKGSKRDLDEIVIALAGPVTNFGIFFFCYFIDLQNTNVYYANLILAFFNLLPIYPLDGGRILKSIGNLQWGKVKSWQVTHFLANSLMIALSATFSIAILYYHNIGIVIMSVYLWGIVIQENRIYERRMKLYEQIEKYKRKEEQSAGKC